MGTQFARQKRILTSMEDKVKRIVVICCLIGIWGILCASTGELAISRLKGIRPGAENLNATIRVIAARGAEIYHYNDQYVLAGIPESMWNEDWQRIQPRSAGQTLYLYSKIKASAPAEIAPYADILADLGSEWLIASDLDITELRGALRGSFTPLKLEAISIPDPSPRFEAAKDTSTDIQNLISQVSADSVLAFIQGMQDLQTRYAMADNRLVVANWIKGQFQRFGITNASLQPFAWNNTTQYNVVATIEGTDYPDEYIVVGGHHDSITNTTPYVLAPGADDNASGSVAAIEMARVLMANNYQPKCSIRFVTFAAEEFGLFGSVYHAETALQNGEDIRLMINHDMIANSDPGETLVQLMPYDGFLEQSQHAEYLTEQYTSLDVAYGYMNSPSSDSHSFWQRGYPVVYYFEYEFCPYYHSDQDITAHINPDYAAEVIRASMAVAISFSDMPGAPDNPQVLDTGNGTSLYVSWDDVADPQVSGYRVYYSGDYWTTTNTVDVAENHYTLSGLNEGTLYQIAISSFGLDGSESYRVFSEGMPLVNPRIPQALSGTPRPGEVLLTWEANTEMDFTGYRIYRSTDPGQTGSVISPASLVTTQFSDTNVYGSPDLYYYYCVSAVDEDGNESLLSPAVKSRPVTLNSGILIIDESEDYPGTTPYLPTDEMVDDFFSSIMPFDTHQMDLNAMGVPLGLADIGVYSSILWHNMDSSNPSAPYAMLEGLEQYLQYGGNIFYTGYTPSTAFTMNAGYPAEFHAGSFIYDVLGIEAVNYSMQSRFKYALPQLDGFPALQVDSLKTISALSGHIIRVETIDPNASATSLYTFGSDYDTQTPQGQFNGETVAVLNEYGQGRVITLSFPLYQMEQSSSRSLMHHVFRYYFDESSSNEDHTHPVVPLQVSSYPNPFKNNSSFRLKGLNPMEPMKLQIFNLKGQLIRSIASDSAKSEIAWDAKDEAGKDVANGIYFVKLSQAGRSVTKKVTRIKR